MSLGSNYNKVVGKCHGETSSLPGHMYVNIFEESGLWKVNGNFSVVKLVSCH